MRNDEIKNRLEEVAGRKSQKKNDVDDDSSYSETKKLKTHLMNLVYNHRAQVNSLECIVAALSGGELDYDIANELRNYVASSENVFLRGKNIINFLNHGEVKPNATNKLETYGRWYSDDYSLKRNDEDTYEFILPPLTSQYKLERRANEGRAIHQLVLYLIDEYVKNGNELELFYDATIEFYHYIDSDMPEISVPDPDNIDIKIVIDALHGFIIESDNLLHMDLAHYGIICSKSYTKIVIKRGKIQQQKTKYFES